MAIKDIDTSYHGCFSGDSPSLSGGGVGTGADTGHAPSAVRMLFNVGKQATQVQVLDEEVIYFVLETIQETIETYLTH